MVFASDLHVCDVPCSLPCKLQALDIFALQQAEGYFGKLSLSQLTLQKVSLSYVRLLKL